MATAEGSTGQPGDVTLLASGVGGSIFGGSGVGGGVLSPGVAFDMAGFSRQDRPAQGSGEGREYPTSAQGVRGLQDRWPVAQKAYIASNSRAN